MTYPLTTLNLVGTSSIITPVGRPHLPVAFATSVASQGVAGWRRTIPTTDARSRRHLAAARLGAGGWLRPCRRSALGRLRRTAAHMGARRARGGAAVAVGADRVWRGIALYFTAPASQLLAVTIVAAIGCCIVAFLARRGRFFVAAVMLAAVACGFAIATWKTARVAHSVLARPLIRCRFPVLSRRATSASTPTASCCASRRWMRRGCRQNSSGCGCR